MEITSVPFLTVILCAAGKLHLVNRKGRIEKSVDAHQGAALAGRWSHDGASILTGVQ